jgi:hypothetical protein
LIDLLYLYPFYNSEHEISELRLDESFMGEELNMERLLEYANRIGNKALSRRINILQAVHNI